MRFDERKITLKDNRECILRPTMPDDAQDMIEYLKLTSAETEYLLRYPDEISPWKVKRRYWEGCLTMNKAL